MLGITCLDSKCVVSFKQDVVNRFCPSRDNINPKISILSALPTIALLYFGNHLKTYFHDRYVGFGSFTVDSLIVALEGGATRSVDMIEIWVEVMDVTSRGRLLIGHFL